MVMFAIFTPVPNNEPRVFTGCRVRYAPSPTGYLHLGNARTALFNFLFARHFKGRFIIRTEDTDASRHVADSLTSQMAALKWLGITADESQFQPGTYGPYQQSQRTHLYRRYWQQFLQQGLIYRCFCSNETLALARRQHQQISQKPFRYSGHCARLSLTEVKTRLQQRELFSLRWKVPPHRCYQFDDLIRGTIKFNSAEIGDWVVMKTDQTPTFNFAVAIDDMLMQITHVIRGEEHISNTPLQLMIYEALQQEPPQFAHLNLIVDHTGRKLSKRNFDQGFFISHYQQQGYLPIAVFNFLALLGWNPGTNQEIFTVPELIKQFNPNRWNKSSSRFELQRLQHVNRVFLQQLSSAEYLQMVMPFLQNSYPSTFNTYPRCDLATICLLYREQIAYAAEISTLTRMFFVSTPHVNPITLATWKQVKLDRHQMITFRNQVVVQTNWNQKAVQRLISDFKEQFKLQGAKLYMPLRIMTSLHEHGPQLTKLIYLLGRKRILKNIDYFMKQVKIKH